MRRALVLCAVAALAACGGDRGEQAATDVTIGGALPGRVTAAMSAQGGGYCEWTHGSATLSKLAIRVSTAPDVCGLAQTGDRKAHDTYVDIQIVIHAHRLVATPITPGVYTVGNTTDDATGDVHAVWASVVRVGDTCYPDTTWLSSGTVTIASLSNGVATGALDLTLDGTDEPVKGTFVAASCSLEPPADPCADLFPVPSGVCRP